MTESNFQTRSRSKETEKKG
ncbi:hypothetical protein, partial [[Clostridium] symbiosum]